MFHLSQSKSPILPAGRERSPRRHLATLLHMVVWIALLAMTGCSDRTPISDADDVFSALDVSFESLTCSAWAESTCTTVCPNIGHTLRLRLTAGRLITLKLEPVSAIIRQISTGKTAQVAIAELPGDAQDALAQGESHTFEFEMPAKVGLFDILEHRREAYSFEDNRWTWTVRFLITGPGLPTRIVELTSEVFDISVFWIG